MSRGRGWCVFLLEPVEERGDLGWQHPSIGWAGVLLRYPVGGARGVLTMALPVPPDFLAEAGHFGQALTRLCLTSLELETMSCVTGSWWPSRSFLRWRTRAPRRWER